MTTLHQAATMALDALEKIYDAAPIDQTRYDLCNTLREALAQPAPEPVAWAMLRADGLVLDVICPDERDAYQGEYTVPLYAAPPAAPAPGDMVMVPREPTPEMLRAGQSCKPVGKWHRQIAKVWDAMLGSAPASSAISSTGTVLVPQLSAAIDQKIRWVRCGLHLVESKLVAIGTDANETQLINLRSSLQSLDQLAEMIAAAPAPVVSDALVEAIAKAIYWEWRRDAGYVPWVDGGNSLKQDDARKIARAVVLSAAPVVPDLMREKALQQATALEGTYNLKVDKYIAGAVELLRQWPAHVVPDNIADLLEDYVMARVETALFNNRVWPQGKPVRMAKPRKDKLMDALGIGTTGGDHG